MTARDSGPRPARKRREDSASRPDRSRTVGFASKMSSGPLSSTPRNRSTLRKVASLSALKSS